MDGNNTKKGRSKMFFMQLYRRVKCIEDGHVFSDNITVNAIFDMREPLKSEYSIFAACQRCGKIEELKQHERSKNG